MQYDNSPITIKVIKWSIRTWWDDLTTEAMINLALMICWITVILGPPATLGVFYVANELVGGQSLGMGGLIEGIRKYFVKAWAWMLVNILVLGVLSVNVTFYNSLQQVWAGPISLIMIILGIFWILVQFYALPYLMLQSQKSLRHAWRNAFMTLMVFPGYTIVILIVVILVLLLSIGLTIPLFLGGIPLIAILACQATRERMEVIRGMQKKQEEGKENKQ